MRAVAEPTQVQDILASVKLPDWVPPTPGISPHQGFALPLRANWSTVAEMTFPLGLYGIVHMDNWDAD